MRPHVLWFDEIYNEELYGSESALKAAQEADFLLTIGTWRHFSPRFNPQNCCSE